jgi:hypothetical protein
MALEMATAVQTPLPLPDMSSPSSNLVYFSFISSISEQKPSSFIRKTPQPHIRKTGCDPLPSSSIDFSSTTCCSFFMLILLTDDERRDGAAALDDAVRLMFWLRPRGDGAWRSCSSPLSENEATRNSGRE